MKNKNLFTFIAGAVTGGLTIWFLRSAEGKEFMEKVKSLAGKITGKENEDKKEEPGHEPG